MSRLHFWVEPGTLAIWPGYGTGNPYTWVGGDAEDLRRVADVLDKAFEAMIAAYKAKAPNIDDAELRRLINEESWLTASEALALGLADEVSTDVKVQACLGQGSTMARYRNTPQALLDELKASKEEPAAPVEPEPEAEPVASTPTASESATLALLITQACSAAGISNLVEPLCITRFAPADYMDTVNTEGLPYYSQLEMMPFKKGVAGEAQSNPLHLVTRPRAIIRLTR